MGPGFAVAFLALKFEDSFANVTRATQTYEPNFDLYVQALLMRQCLRLSTKRLIKRRNKQSSL